MELRDSCGSRRQVADLLRWSTGKEPRYGKKYVDYKSPIDQASTSPSFTDTAKNYGRNILTTLVSWRHGHENNLTGWIFLEDTAHHRFKIRFGLFNGAVESIDAVIDAKFNKYRIWIFLQHSFVEIRHSPF